MFIIITGNPVDGFEYLGPFGTEGDAINHAECSLADDNIDWWTASLSDDNGSIKSIQAVTRQAVVDAAAALRSVHGENPEYDRALVELVSDSFGGSHEDAKRDIGVEAASTSSSTTFEVKQVDVVRGPFWTVSKLIKGFNFGGDHHWLGKEIAESAKRLYEVNPAMWGRSSTDVIAAYTTRFGEPPTGLIEG